MEIKQGKAIKSIVYLVLISLPIIACLLYLRPPLRENIILVTLDTTRADQIACHDSSASWTPRICEFGAQSSVYTNAYSQSSWTLPSHASIMTGAYPHEHGATRWHVPINSRFPTVAEILKSNGFKTAAFAGVVWLDEKYGFARGVDDFKLLPYQDGSVRAKEITDGVLAWLTKTESPFFIWVHYFDPHNDFIRHPNGPYKYSESTPTHLSYLKWNDIAEEHSKLDKSAYLDLYRGELAHVDEQLGRIFDFVNSRELSNKTTIIVTSDHGESFGNHSHAGHDSTLYRDLIHVPLIIHTPGQSPRVRTEVVETRQIAATILQQAGVKKLDWMAPSLPSSDGSAFSDVQNRNRYRKVSITTQERQLIYTAEKEIFELYAHSDTDQISDLAASENYDTLQKQLFERLRIINHDSETLKQLKSLGYVN